MDEPESEGSDDYVWHFRLGAADEAIGGGEALTEMVRRQVSALLRCVRFTSGGRDVNVTGFRFLDDAACEHPVSLTFGEDDLDEAE
jgi:hypothetical protein